MALDKWQERELERYAGENGMTRAEALAELFPEEVPAPRKRAAAAPKVDTAKVPAPAA